MPRGTCKYCGSPATSRDAETCLACRPKGRENQRQAASKSLRERWAKWKEVPPTPEAEPVPVSKPGRLGYTGKQP